MKLESLAISVMMTCSVTAATVDFGPQNVVFADGIPLDAGTVSSATVADWNGDGLPDLVVGSLVDMGGGWNAGKLSLFLNSGVIDSPVYTYSTYMQADGEDIELPWDN